MKDLRKAYFESIKKAIKENVMTTAPDGRIASDAMWRNISKSSKLYNRIDLNYLAAHTRLPLASFLASIHVSRSDRCRLCSEAPETQEHLFYHCNIVQELKSTLNRDIARMKTAPKPIRTYLLLMTHTPKVSRDVNELLSIFKQCIWQVRGALFYGPENINNIRNELKTLYIEKKARTS